jgi:hypothetical protein
MMKIIYSLISILFVSTSVFAQATTAKLSPLTKKYLFEVSKLKGEKVSMYNYIYKKTGGRDFLSALILVDNTINESELNSLGVQLGTKAGNIWCVQIPAGNAEAFTRLRGIEYIQFDEPAYPDLDNARIDTRVDSVHQGINLSMPYNGNGVVTGIIDAGYDFEHPAFFDTTGTIYRVKKSWLQKSNSGTPPAGYSYGTELTDTTSHWTTGNDNGDSHATHVGGICAGSGFGSTTNKKYRGFAYKSDLVFVAITPDKSQWINTGVSDMIDGINYIFDYATSVSKPAVINLSWGSPLGPRDGTGLFSQALDNLTGPGRIFVCSAGNNGDNPIHLQRTFTSADTVVHTFLEIANSPIGKTTWVDAWGDTAKSFCMQVALYNNSIIDSTGFICTDDSIYEFTLIGSNNDTCLVTLLTSSSEFNLKPRILIEFSSDVADSILISVKSSDGTVNMWNTFVYNTSGYYGEFLNYGYPWAVNGDVNTTISDIASSKSAITVGAYISKRSWVDVSGNTWTYSSLIKGDLAYFSSRGPTIDGRVKPDITGPGMTIASAISSFDSSFYSGTNGYDFVVNIYHDPSNNRNYPYAQLSGTSMASPAVSGITALMLQVKNDLSPQEAKDIFTQTAITDGFTGSIPPGGDNTWGNGKVNAYGAVKSAVQIVAGINNVVGELQGVIVYPNPANGVFYINYEGGERDDVLVSLYDLSGRSIIEKYFRADAGMNLFVMDANMLTPGMYFVKILAEGKSAVQKILITD